MEITRRRQILAGGSLSLFGLLLTSVTLVHIYEDAVAQAEPLILTVVENALPIALNLCIAGAGILLVRRSEFRGEFVSRVSIWGLLGALSLFSVSLWVYLFQIMQGEVEPALIFSHIVSMGTVAGLGVGIYDDQRRQRQAQLTAEHDKLSALFESTSDAIAEVEYVDGEAVVRDVNPGFRESFGYSVAAAEGNQLDELIVPPGDDDFERNHDRAMSGEMFGREEIFRQTADGEIRVFRLQAIPLDAADADTDGYAVYTDITSEYRYESRLRSLHEATRELVTIGSVDAVAEATVDAAHDLLDVDFVTVFSHDADENELRPVEPQDPEKEPHVDPSTSHHGTAIARAVFESGTPRYVPDRSAAEGVDDDTSVVASELVVPIGRFGVLLLGSRITDGLDESQQSLGKILASNVEVAMERAERQRRLERQNDRLETFASVVSHDLRNPLGVADGYLELAREGDEDAFERVERAHDRMEGLIEDLLALAREGEHIDEATPVALDRIARRAWEQATTPNAALRIEATGQIEADPGRLQQLFENLFANAVEHGIPEGPDRDAAAADFLRAGEDDGESPVAITVTVERTERGFAVEDDGVGIPQEQRSSIFDHGYSNDAGGTGLGLSIVEEIADAHGWTVRAEAGSDGGARFVFVTT
ncbi:MAG: ATP-binding protein [Halobellus sp.]|uniref:sensor histidine kinase n=1 Tax=Halobellus sp. TaxID=1979212 RepID=UPI0035D42D0D